jgi:probable H4MPT-linked C1 transfer pathway protein
VITQPAFDTPAVATLGLDVGGANLKAAHTDGTTRSRPFALWKHPDGLADALRDLIHDLPRFDQLAVTMTGELCDCYETKRQGVVAILDAVAKLAGSTQVQVWCNDGRFVSLATAREQPLLVAAANWLALATFAGRYAPTGSALLVDIGSTTTDVIPLADGQPIPQGRTDPERLRTGELVYVGVRRTPLCAVIGGEGAAELFATTHDLFLVLDSMPEDDADRDTADGRPATKSFAHARLARMLGGDAETLPNSETHQLALRGLAKLGFRIQQAIEGVARPLARPLGTVIVSGSGEFLARGVVNEMLARLPFQKRISLAEQVGQEISRAACAYAVAVLAAGSSGH